MSGICERCVTREARSASDIYCNDCEDEMRRGPSMTSPAARETSCCESPRIWFVSDLAAYTYGGPIYPGAAFCRNCEAFFDTRSGWQPKPGDGKVEYQ